VSANPITATRPEGRHRATPRATPRSTGTSSVGDSYRSEIQGLRALAVLLVVLFHLWPRRLPGGYVGVDVFFVISGFLITSHMVREVDRTGTLRVGRFWARRIRRLLPASLLVLVLSTFLVLAVVPATLWHQTARQVAASALYVQNWALALDSVDYMAADNVPTVAQHYWSLSVEEQFYLVWPLLVVALVAVGVRRHSGRPSPVQHRRQLAAGIFVLAVASLIWSMVSTAHDQAFAYLSTFTRAWEFAAGALASLLIVRRVPRALARAALGWAGVVLIVAAAVLFDEESLFPGSIALLPVLGTVAVITAGRGSGLAAPGTWLSIRPARFLGDISYSVYLVHWPLIVVASYVLGDSIRWPQKLLILALTILLAWGSKRFVEDPMRVRPLLAAAPWRAFAFGVAGMLVVVAAGVGVNAQLERREAEAQAIADGFTEQVDACTGPGALDAANNCPHVVGTGELFVPPEVVVQQNTDPPYPQCQQGLAASEVTQCELGETDNPIRTVALVGDSHAAQWFTAFDQLGRENGWRVVTMAKASCPLSHAVRVLASESTDTEALSCQTWVDKVQVTLQGDPKITDVFVTAYSTAYEWKPRSGRPLADPGPDGFAAVWSELARSGKRVVVLAAVPRTTGENIPTCVASHPDDRLACSVPRTVALPGDVMVQAVERLGDPHVRLIDLTDRYCDRHRCYPVVGGVLVYRDYSHLSAEYSMLLVPTLLDRYDALGG
jgi:peptidoglycan/LPS O-acetylase OafA/YrhL